MEKMFLSTLAQWWSSARLSFTVAMMLALKTAAPVTRRGSTDSVGW